jgi:hypothetical protein
MCRPRVGAANPLFSLWRALWRPSAPASRTKSRRTTEVSRTNKMYASTTVLLSCATCRLDQFFQILVLDFRRHVVFFFLHFISNILLITHELDNRKIVPKGEDNVDMHEQFNNNKLFSSHGPQALYKSSLITRFRWNKEKTVLQIYKNTLDHPASWTIIN